MTGEFVQIDSHAYIAADMVCEFQKLGLTDFDSFFNFKSGSNLTKNNLALHRGRMLLQAGGKNYYLKTYTNTPKKVQIKNRLAHGTGGSCMDYDLRPCIELPRVGIAVPKVVAYGRQMGAFFEKRSFIVTGQVENADKLENKLPECFENSGRFSERKNLIEKLACIIARFHRLGYRHRDLYLAHIFYNPAGVFTLIDLHRVFKPGFWAERFRIKDIAQLNYSCPAGVISGADRMRFYKKYALVKKLSKRDKWFICKVMEKCNQMARHDRKHGRIPPFAAIGN